VKLKNQIEQGEGEFMLMCLLLAGNNAASFSAACKRYAVHSTKCHVVYYFMPYTEYNFM